MAKATAYCKCETCGTEFTRTANKGLRAEADSWALWAAGHYTECPACYAKRMRSEEPKNPITALVGLDVLNAQIVISITGNTRPVKDALKSRGYRWDVPFETGLSGILDMGTRFNACWSKELPAPKYTTAKEFSEAVSSAVSDAIRSLKEIIPELESKNSFTQMDHMLFCDMAKHLAEDGAAVASAIAALEKPERPVCYPAGRWNGKFYGNPGNWRIYLDNTETSISDEDVSAIKNYKSALAAYKEKVEEIKNAN